MRSIRRLGALALVLWALSSWDASGGRPRPGAVWLPLSFTCDESVVPFDRSVTKNEAPEASAAEQGCGLVESVAISDGTLDAQNDLDSTQPYTYWFKTSFQPSEHGPVVRYKHIGALKRGPLGAATTHSAHGMHRFTLPANPDGGDTPVRFDVSNTLTADPGAQIEQQSVELMVFDSELGLVVDLSGANGSVELELPGGVYLVRSSHDTAYTNMGPQDPVTGEQPRLRGEVTLSVNVPTWLPAEK